MINLTDELRATLKAQFNKVRIKFPGGVYTQDYNPMRANVHIDGNKEKT